MIFKDGVKDFFNELANIRSSIWRNRVTSNRLSDNQLKEAYNTGLMSKIIRLKAGYALNDTLSFDSEEKQAFFDERIASSVKQAAKFMLGFGRGVIVIFEVGDDLTKPLSPHEVPENLELRVFSGDIAKGQEIDIDLFSKRYGKPSWYQINGHQVHHSRVIDFSYYKPVERDLPKYWYGGISETELIYEQLVSDGVVQRASASMLEKSSTFIYKIKGYKERLGKGQHEGLARYVSNCEDGRSIHGALIVDSEDEIEVKSQSLTDLDKIDNVALRRLANKRAVLMQVVSESGKASKIPLPICSRTIYRIHSMKSPESSTSEKSDSKKTKVNPRPNAWSMKPKPLPTPKFCMR